MCSGSLPKKMLLFALPLMFSSILQLLFNAADLAVAGKCVGYSALAAIGSTGALINLLTNLFLGLSVGANVLVARYIGSKQDREVEETGRAGLAVRDGRGGPSGSAWSAAFFSRSSACSARGRFCS